MPDIGLLELILIGIVAFLVLGPERMPDLISQVGRTIRHARKWMSDIKQQIHDETEVLRGEVGDVKDALSDGMSTMPEDESDTRANEPEAKKPR